MQLVALCLCDPCELYSNLFLALCALGSKPATAVAAVFGAIRRSDGEAVEHSHVAPRVQILDIPKTLEYLETQGVTVAAWQADEFPAFFTPHSGCQAPCRFDTLTECAPFPHMPSSHSLYAPCGPCTRTCPSSTLVECPPAHMLVGVASTRCLTPDRTSACAPGGI